MSRRAITTSQTPVNCDVCGRTLLRGEREDVFLSEGTRRTVCELCVARAAHEGWIREGIDDTPGVRPRAERRSLLHRLRQRREAAPRELAGRVGHLPGPGEPDPETGSFERFGRRRTSGNGAHGGFPRAPRQVHAVPTNADLKTARAMDVFNVSRHPRTVAGVARSLGAPFVVVRPSAQAGSLVTIVVGWELCWYRYEVDLADEVSGPRLVAQGEEVVELEAADRIPNAAADERGELVPASP